MIEKGHTDLDLKAKEELTEWMIGLLLSDEHPGDEILDEVRSYLADNRDSVLKEEILDKLFLVAFQSERSETSLATSVMTGDMWSQIAPTLGLNPDLNHYRVNQETRTLLKALRRPTWHRRVAMRVAAVLIPVFVVVGGAWLWSELSMNKDHAPILTNVEVSVDEDSQKRIVLPDGSQVWVNSSTTIAYNDDFSKERTVTLDGEAFFSVVHDSLSPFRVKTADLTIEVLGTEFNVHSRSNESIEQVILTEGSVEVNMPHNKEMHLVPGERMTYDMESSEISIDQIDVETIASWRVVNLRMVNMPLDEALERIAIYYGRTLKVEGTLPADVFVDLAHVARFDVEQVLESLRDITNNCFNYRLAPDIMTVYPHI
jgi:ferric-dicitrate binding protein FerR (iron transport regulator)